MKRLFLFLFLAFVFFSSKGQYGGQCSGFSQNQDSSFICVIGTTHYNTGYCNGFIIDSILQLVKPDLILDELDSAFFTKDFEYKLSSYIESSPVGNGILRYKKSHTIDLRPFDITGRNDFYRKNDFFKLQDSLYRTIYSFWKSGKLNERNQNSASLIFSTLEKINKVEVKSLKELNSQILLYLLEIHHFIYLNNTIEIVESTDSLQKFAPFAILQKKFLDERNNTMIKNILFFHNKYKRIVVFTGNLHRYYLLNALREKKSDFALKEFWEF